MPGKIARRAGKYDAPACVGGAAPKLAVDEIGQPPEAEADRHHTGDIVVDAQPVELVPPRHQDNRKAHPDDATVKRHAALPQLPHFEDRQSDGDGNSVDVRVSSGCRRTITTKN